MPRVNEHASVTAGKYGIEVKWKQGLMNGGPLNKLVSFRWHLFNIEVRLSKNAFKLQKSGGKEYCYHHLLKDEVLDQKTRWLKNVRRNGSTWMRYKLASKLASKGKTKALDPEVCDKPAFFHWLNFKLTSKTPDSSLSCFAGFSSLNSLRGSLTLKLGSTSLPSALLFWKMRAYKLTHLRSMAVKASRAGLWWHSWLVQSGIIWGTEIPSWHGGQN